MNRSVLKILILLYLVAFGWWLFLFFKSQTDGLGNNLYGVILGVIPFIGGIYGVIVSKKWGLLESALGKATLFLSLGNMSWGIGTFIYSVYYNFIRNVDIPYPSLADAAYILSLPLWAIGMFQLSKATGAKYGIKESSGKSILFILPLLVVLGSYYLLVIVARGGSIDISNSGLLKIFFDFAYPIGDVLILTLSILLYGLSYNYFGGKFKSAIYCILAGFVVLYIADFLFSYTTTLGTFYSGSWIDFLFVTAMFLLALGVNAIDSRVLVVKEDTV